MQRTPWLIRQSATPQPGGPHRIRLFCFSYAGGSAASYAPWQALFGPEVEVCGIQLPGRGARMVEAPYTDLSLMVKDLAALIVAQKSMPFAFFGHSLGGLVAFELARYCQLHHLPMPLQLFASGCSAPQFRNPSKNLHLLSDDDLIGTLKDYNGTPPEILAHRELMELVLPVIRADFGLAETYQYRPGALLNIPVTVLAGKRDERNAAEQVEGWAKETSAPCQVNWFEGDHFFINGERAEVVALVAKELGKLINPL
jgi:medium-chain acyl-[acyl-carrier-protein] hydrolase